MTFTQLKDKIASIFNDVTRVSPKQPKVKEILTDMVDHMQGGQSYYKGIFKLVDGEFVFENTQNNTGLSLNIEYIGIGEAKLEIPEGFSLVPFITHLANDALKNVRLYLSGSNLYFNSTAIDLNTPSVSVSDDSFIEGVAFLIYFQEN